MKTRILGMVLVLTLLATFRGAAQASDQAVRPNTGQIPATTYAFLSPADEATEPASEPQAATPTGPHRSQAGQAIIIDHTTTNIKAIPQAWIEAAKNTLNVYYGHTSHGSQLVDGMAGLVSFANNGGLGLALPDDIFSGLNMYEASPDAGYYPDWVNNTRAYLGTPSSTTGRGTAHPEVNVVIWSWCGQVSSISEQDLRTNYLEPMNQLEVDYPGVRFVYMTGHSDGSGETGNLHLRNQQIRQYVIQNNKTLYDFYNIELYDPDGNYYGNKRVNDYCDYDSDGDGTRDKNWAQDWQNTHTQDVDWYSCGCAHSQSLNCNQKAYAAWWLWARLAGWPGPDASSPLTLDKSVALTHNPARPGDPITYTIVVRNTSVTDTVGVHITDTLPTYVVGANLDTTRVVTGNSAVTITVPATVASNVPSGATIINTAVFSHTSGGGSDSASFTVSTLLPNLSTSTKRVNATTVQAGGLVTFTIVLSNTGLAAATVRYTDTLPTQVDWVSGSLNEPVSVNAGVSTSRVIVARVKRDLRNETVFNNTVAINDGVHAVFNFASPNVTVQAPDFSTSVRTVNKSVFDPGEYITYTLTLSNSGGMAATVRYTVTLPTEVMSPTGALSGTVTASRGSLLLPAVVVARVRPDLANGVTFHSHVDINDGYHPVYTLDFPVTAIHAFLTRLPLVMRNYSPSSGQAIIIDHTTTDISKIPNYWLEQAKKLTFHYAHTSHGSQINSGIEWLETQNSKYNFDIEYGATPPVLPPDTTALRIYDGNNVTGGDTYITPELYWSTPNGIQNTRSVANTSLFSFSMWSWCGQQSGNSEETVQQYLDTLNQFETQYPNMHFIYMTGHTDSTGAGGTLFRNNDMVRQYVRQHGRVLFDFADIETYDPVGGGPYVNDGMGACEWCATWCQNHPGYCDSLPSSCAHTEDQPEQRLFCKLKGQAFWWMMARLAGWDGVTP